MTKEIKHAYLILAHKSTYTLHKLIESLDDERNDIYIHIDLKSEISSFKEYKTKTAQLNFITERYPIIWGGFNMVLAELALLRAATENGKYKYYHLLSGNDLPLKNQNEIHNFFDNKQLAYIESTLVDPQNGRFWRSIYRRISVRRFFIKYKGQDGLVPQVFSNIDRMLILIQEKILRRDFVKKNKLKLYYGSQWFSLPDDIVRYVLSKSESIQWIFGNSYIPDELFLQTIIENSSLKERIENDNLRYIVFDAEKDSKHPHIWKMEDYNKLRFSDCFFARKFDDTIDKKIILKVTDG
ncbi:beta-1,6-N-acetylglucosaminyltransferase [Ligilactobacillus agilis]|uniref:beta-1,6-N-acetylglucosaminyltransferase n=1 Tax=Ligilactobacillus agilis TaxID=1601 RepID=UPI00254ECA01|nr:beta-1,6-N-acetylglucosaminyltransferase [Ligilactobacillus agilis]MDK6809132.1 beta-1,6-N-acetylglucosaminyltransferase [Ligilactobacillus agilis]